MCGPGTLGGDELPACFDGYLETKLANSVMTRAFHCRFQEGGCKVKNVCAEPATSQTDLGSNLARGHPEQGSDVSASWAALLSRCPLMLACSATDMASWDLFMPGGSVQETAYGRADRATHAQKWMAETFENETLTLNPAKHDLLMFASVIAVGVINGPLHFIGDDQARTSVKQNVLEAAPLAWYAEPGAGIKSKRPMQPSTSAWCRDWRHCARCPQLRGLRFFQFHGVG